jgi:hypothetical protein
MYTYRTFAVFPLLHNWSRVVLPRGIHMLDNGRQEFDEKLLSESDSVYIGLVAPRGCDRDLQLPLNSHDCDCDHGSRDDCTNARYGCDHGHSY